MDVALPLVLFAALGAIAVVLLSLLVRAEERQWLVRTALAALAVRMTMATIFALVPSSRLFHEDAAGYEYVGMRVAMGWQGLGPPIDLNAAFHQNYGFYYICAILYYLLGQLAPIASYFNCVIGTATVVMVYQLARQFFHPLVARRATLLVAFVPSMILWSSVAIKDPLMALLILVGLQSCVAIKRRFSVAAAIGIAFSLLAMQPIRFYMVYFLGFAIAVSLFLERGVRLVSGVYKQLLVVGMFVALLVVAGFTERTQEGLQNLSFEQVSSFRHGMAVSANSGFEANVDVSTPGKALLFLPLGVAELLLGPFPWQFASMRALMAAPETIYWWILFPSTLSGMWWMFRKRFASTSALLLFAVTLTCAYSLVHGNIGSGFRQRAQIFVILFIFAAVGRYRSRCLRAGLDPELLLVDGPRPAATRAAAVAA
jgi:4-amino-4-deoxy-L-arabinose transferase-like glycosyltransferase